MNKKCLLALAALAIVLSLAGCDLGNAAAGGDAIAAEGPSRKLTGTTRDGSYIPFKDFLGVSSKQAAAKAEDAYEYFKDELYKEVPGDKTMAYILDNYNDEIRSEGMSYGMMIFVQMDYEDGFKKLWKLAKKYMRFDSSSKFEGFFHWRLYGSGDKFLEKKGSIGMAPDGELYMAAALILAYNKWGTTEYKNDATDLILRMINYDTKDKNKTSFFYPGGLVKHWPENGSTVVTTNPSYHLPAFHQLFISFLPNSSYPDAKAVYASIRDQSRYFLKKCLEQSEYRLPPDTSDEDGIGKNWGSDGKEFANDAWRVAMNITLDVDWNGPKWYGKTGNKGEEWLRDYAKKFCDFFESKNTSGKRDYKDQWYTDGTPFTKQDGHKIGLVAMNAMVSCLLPDYMETKHLQAKRYMRELWDYDITEEKNYYNICLYTLAILWGAGEYNLE